MQTILTLTQSMHEFTFSSFMSTYPRHLFIYRLLPRHIWPFFLSSEILHIEKHKHIKRQALKKLFIHMWNRKIIYGNNENSFISIFCRQNLLFLRIKSLKHKFRSHDNSTKAINHYDDDESLFYFLLVLTKCKSYEDQYSWTAKPLPKSQKISFKTRSLSFL